MQDGINKKITSSIQIYVGGGRAAWLDGLKGLLCLQVFLGHFYIAFFWEDIFQTPSRINNFFLLLFTGCVTVPFFCCISGFLLEKKKVNKIYDLQIRILNRFLRFELPLLPIFFLIMLLVRKTNVYDFANLLAEELYNKRLYDYFPSEAHFTHLYKKPFYSLSYYIGPLWMMKSLFYAGICIYCKNLIINLIKQFKETLSVYVEVLIYIFLFEHYRNDMAGLSVIFGSLIARLMSTQFISNNNRLNIIKYIVTVSTLIISFLHIYIYMSYKMFSFVLERYFSIEGLFFCFIVFIYIILTKAKALFEYKLFQFLGKNSFGIYITHDIVIACFSTPLIYYLKKIVGYKYSVIIVFPFSIFAVCFTSVLFTCIEKILLPIIKKVIAYLEKH